MFLDGGIKKVWVDTLANVLGTPAAITIPNDSIAFDASDFPDEEETTVQLLDGTDDQTGVKQVLAIAILDIEGTEYTSIKSLVDNKQRLCVGVRARNSDTAKDEVVFGLDPSGASGDGLIGRFVSGSDMRYGSRPYVLLILNGPGGRGGDTRFYQTGTV